GLAARHRRLATAAPAGAPPTRAAVVWHFLRDFRPRVRYDDFKWYDWRPGVVEAVSLLALLLAWLLEPVRRVASYLRRPAVASPAAAPPAPPHSPVTRPGPPRPTPPYARRPPPTDASTGPPDPRHVTRPGPPAPSRPPS